MAINSGISPPEKSIVIRIKYKIKFLPGKSFIESEYAAIEVKNKFSKVPTMVINIVTLKPFKIVFEINIFS